jgi:hypothetical protein
MRHSHQQKTFNGDAKQLSVESFFIREEESYQ